MEKISGGSVRLADMMKPRMKEAGVPMRTRMECNECSHRFNKTITANTYEAQCPNCHGYDTEPVGVF